MSIRKYYLFLIYYFKFKSKYHYNYFLYNITPNKVFDILSKFLFVVFALFLSPMSPFKNKMLIYQQFQKIRMVGTFKKTSKLLRK